MQIAKEIDIAVLELDNDFHVKISVVVKVSYYAARDALLLRCINL